jgi:hypothetical protein
MMDAKMAAHFVRTGSNLYHVVRFIEDQDRELTILREQIKSEAQMRLLAAKIKKGEVVIPPDALVFRDTGEDIEQGLKEELEQIKYAELGRLFAKCSVECEKENCRIDICDISKACRKRAELLEGEK